MKRLKTLFTVLLMVMTTAAFAQSKTLAKANKFYKTKEYAAAIPLFEKSLEEKSTVTTQTKLAFCYKSVNQIDKAEKLYSDIVYAEKPKLITFYYYGEALMRNGKYAAAKFWFEEYLKKKPGDPKSIQMIESCDKVNLIKPYFGYVEVTPFSMNSDSDDNAPVMLGDQLVFCSDRKQKIKLLKQKSGVTGRDFISIYQSQKQANGSFTEPIAFSSKINGLNKNTGPISFDASGNIAVFSRNGDVANKQEAYTLQLYEAVKEGGKWKNVELLNFCKPGFNYMHPAISPDGQMLFFICDRAGGSGGTEIYQSKRKADGTWNRPVNLGDVVNTSSHEGFPFYDTEGRLFFSSKGHIGFGGYDVFYTSMDDLGNWTKPVNVGFPVNSSSDDISIYVAADGESGMFTSCRSGTSDNIFLFQNEDTPIETPAAPIAVSVPTPVETKREPVVTRELVEEVKPVEPEVPSIEIAHEEPVLEEPEIATEETALEEAMPEVEEVLIEKGGAKIKKKKEKKEKKGKRSRKEEAADVVEAPTEVATEAVNEVVVEEEPSLTEMIAELEGANQEEPAILPSTPTIEESTKNLVSETPEVPQTFAEPITIEEITETTAEIIEPSRLNINPEMVEETLEIEESDLASTLTLSSQNALTEFADDLTNNAISAEKPYDIPNVDYDFNNTDIDQDLMIALDELANILTAHPNVEIQILGHTASFGSNSKNQQLSETRAQNVANYLTSKGIASNRVAFAGLGETQLLNGCVDGILCSMDQHKVNERLEVKVVRH